MIKDIKDIQEINKISRNVYRGRGRGRGGHFNHMRQAGRGAHHRGSSYSRTPYISKDGTGNRQKWDHKKYSKK